MLSTKFQFIRESGFRLRGVDFFRNQPIRNKNGLWRPCLLMDRDKMCNLQRIFYRCFLPSDGKSSHCIWQCELTNKGLDSKILKWTTILKMSRMLLIIVTCRVMLVEIQAPGSSIYGNMEIIKSSEGAGWKGNILFDTKEHCDMKIK